MIEKNTYWRIRGPEWLDMAGSQVVKVITIMKFGVYHEVYFLTAEGTCRYMYDDSFLKAFEKLDESNRLEIAIIFGEAIW